MLSKFLIRFESIPRIFPDGTSFGRLKYSVSTMSKLLGCVNTRFVTSSVVTGMYWTLIPVSSKSFLSISEPIVVAVPR